MSWHLSKSKAQQRPHILIIVTTAAPGCPPLDPPLPRPAPTWLLLALWHSAFLPFFFYCFTNTLWVTTPVPGLTRPGRTSYRVFPRRALPTRFSPRLPRRQHTYFILYPPPSPWLEQVSHSVLLLQAESSQDEIPPETTPPSPRCDIRFCSSSCSSRRPPSPP